MKQKLSFEEYRAVVADDLAKKLLEVLKLDVEFIEYYQEGYSPKRCASELLDMVAEGMKVLVWMEEREQQLYDAQMESFKNRPDLTNGIPNFLLESRTQAK